MCVLGQCFYNFLASGNVDLTEFSKQLERYTLSDKGLLFLFFNLDKNDDEVIDETDIAKEFEKFDKNSK